MDKILYKRIFSAALIFALILTFLPMGTLKASAAGGVWSGNGTSGNPYLIEDLADLVLLANNVNSGTTYATNGHDGYNANFKLMTDIDLTGYDAGDGGGWMPIGSGGHSFCGNFDGNGHVITNITINRPGMTNVGLFGAVAVGGSSLPVISNLGIASGTITGKSNVGGVVGTINYSSVTNCYNSATVSGVSSAAGANDSSNVGGVVGYGTAQGIITNCYNTGSVNGDYSNIGGVVGFNSVSITGCYNTGAVSCTGYTLENPVSGYNYIGGVVGNNNPGITISNCYNTGVVTGVYNYIGGIVGGNYGCTASNCFNTGAVSGTFTGAQQVGGIAGYNISGTVVSCYNTGAVSGYDTIGGLAGNGTVQNSYSVGTVNTYGGVPTPTAVGGVVGSGTATNCYYSNSTYPAPGVGVGTDTGTSTVTGLSTAQMTDENVLTGAMSGLGTSFVKRLHDSSNYYYPELSVFYGGTATQQAASKISAAVPRTDTGSLPALTGTVTLSINANTGAVTANAAADNTTPVGTLTYTWSGGATGTGATVTPTPGVATSCTVSASDATGSIASTEVTVYQVNVTTSGAVGTDAASITDRFGKVDDSVSIAYTVGTSGTMSNSISFSGGTVNSSSSPATYVIAANDATNGIVTITATFTHTNLAAPTLALTPTPTTATFGGPSPTVLSATAVLAGGNAPTGSITFTLVYGGTTVNTQTVPVNGAGAYTTPAGYTLPTNVAVTGLYQWNATYNGDANNSSASDTGSIGAQVTVSPRDISNVTVTVTGSTVYTGSAITPAFSVSDGTLAIGAGDYTVSYSNNISVTTQGGSIILSGQRNYNGTKTVSFVISKAPAPDITWPTAASTITYGSVLSDSTLSGGAGDGVFAWTDGTQIPGVTNSGYEVTFTPNDDVNYDYTGVTLTSVLALTVDPKAITVTADDKDKYIGADDPALTWTAPGLLSGDTLTGSLTYTGSAAGSYDIVQDVPFSNPNYTITFVKGTMTIRQTPTVQDVIDMIDALPNPVVTTSDADKVATVTNAFGMLSDQALIPPGEQAALATAQQQSATVNETNKANGVVISGANLPWYIRLEVTPYTSSSSQYSAFAGKLSGKKLLALYDLKLVNTLTGAVWEPPAGTTVTVDLSKVNLAGATGVAVVHQKTGGAMETLKATVKGKTVTFTASSFSLYGVTATPATSSNSSTSTTATPNTGDYSNMAMWLWMGCAALIILLSGLTRLVRMRRVKNA